MSHYYDAADARHRMDLAKAAGCSKQEVGEAVLIAAALCAGAAAAHGGMPMKFYDQH